MYGYSEEWRQNALNDALAAVRAWVEVGPDTPKDQARALHAKATATVTTAVTRGGYLHTEISGRVAVSGLRVIELITDMEVRSKALAVEHNAATQYLRLVREAQAEMALRRVGAEGYGSASRIMKDLGVSRATFYTWLRDSELPETAAIGAEALGEDAPADAGTR